jgi:hypothetical protein
MHIEGLKEEMMNTKETISHQRKKKREGIKTTKMM